MVTTFFNPLQLKTWKSSVQIDSWFLTLARRLPRFLQRPDRF